MRSLSINAPGKDQAAAADIQCKLTVGSVNDPLEAEADAVADRVMRMPESAIIQRKCAHCEEEEVVQRKPLVTFIQKKQTSQGTNAIASDAVSNKIQSAKGGGSPLESSAKSFMETRFGSDFSGVRVHTDNQAIQLSKELNAQAFTVGKNIFFNEGKYQPKSNSGKKILAHELTHVVQQSHENGATAARTIQRMPCAALLDPVSNLIKVNGSAAHKVIEGDFHSKVQDAIKIFIPGASAAPQRTEGKPGQDGVIDPQLIGGMAGKGFPDLAKMDGSILEVGEIKPADWLWVAEGIAQLSRYVKNGNDTDTEQQSWRKSKGISTVVPMSPLTYIPTPLLTVNSIPIQVAWCGPGLIVYKPLRPKQDPIKLPEWKHSPAWDKVLLAAMMTAMAAGTAAMIKKMNPASRAAAAAAIIYLLASGKAEAKLQLNTQDPLEALFKALEQDGIPISGELKTLLENDPELKKMVEEAAKKGGNLSDVQKEMSRQYADFLNKNIDKFSREELKALISITEISSDKMPADLNVEDIKKALEKKGIEKQATEEEEEKKTEEKKEEPAFKLSSETKKRIAEASPETRIVYDAWLKKDPQGTLKLTDGMVAKFLDAMTNLTKEESQYLVAHLQPGATFEQSLESLTKGLEDFRSKKNAETEKGEEETEENGPSKVTDPSVEDGISKDEHIDKMIARIKKFKGWKNFSGFSIRPVGAINMSNAEINKDIFPAMFYQWINYSENGTTKMLRSAAHMTLKVITRGNDESTIEVVSCSTQVLENGATRSGFAPGHKITGNLS